MVQGQHLNTRVSQKAYKALLQKCADKGCSPYEYLRQLVYADIGLDVQEPVAKKKNQTEWMI